MLTLSFSLGITSCLNSEIFLRRVFRVVLGKLRSFANLATFTFLGVISYFVLCDELTCLDLLFEVDFL